MFSFLSNIFSNEIDNIGTVFSKITFTVEEVLRRLHIIDNIVIAIFTNMILSISIIPA